MKQLIAILMAFGMSKAEAEKVSNLTEDELKEWKPDEVSEKIRGNVKTALSNDQSFLDTIPEEKIPAAVKKNIEKNQYARFQNELIDVATKELGLEDKDLTEDDRKSIKKLAGKMANLYLTKKGSVEGLQKMQTELAQARQDLTKKDEDWKTKLDTETGAIKNTYSQKIIRSLAQSALSSLDKVKLNVGASYLTDPVLNKLNSKYKVMLSDNDELTVKQKENDKLDVVDKGGKILTFNDVLRQTVLEDKLGIEVKEEEGGGSGGRSRIIVDEGGGGEQGGIKIPGYIEESINSTLAAEGAKQ